MRGARTSGVEENKDGQIFTQWRLGQPLTEWSLTKA